ncbi:hypothetical protein CN918_28740 [Priestia megaterium]|nr:hypothetical protein CN918_28740 [Priestia megaterium]
MNTPIDKSNEELIELEMIKTFDECNKTLEEMLSLLKKVQDNGTNMDCTSHPNTAKHLNTLVRTVKQLDVMINQK